MMSAHPYLPEITKADLVLAVYVHESLNSESDAYGEAKRLALLGHCVLEQAITFHYFMKNPSLSPEDIAVQRQLNSPNFPHLLHQYGLRHKIRCLPEEAHTLDAPEVAQQIFHKYIGALFVQNGVNTVQEWVSQLIEPGCQTPLIPLGTTNSPTHPSVGYGNMQPPPPPPLTQPPPLPPPAYSSGGLAPAPAPSQSPPIQMQNNFQILAQFNMTAHQRGYTVTYPAKSEGPHHTPVWHVECRLNDEVRGRGSGKNQKQAKELAARQAWTCMGWGHLPEQ